MQYLMRSGILSLPQSGQALAQVKSTFLGPRKQIQTLDTSATFQADIRAQDAPAGLGGDVRFKAYTLTDGSGALRMEAHPSYAQDEDPDVTGWPVCRVPRVDQADIALNGAHCTLTMHNSQNYSLKGEDGHTLLQIMHRGIAGGWLLDTQAPFDPEILCGLFTFCRYLEQENEFLVV